ncbi:nickel pincer cofactor biosynthesis protein LarC [Alkalicoccus chagannorensis]|uniref:nickel pincer cofactor biosynthesis protein LarC n=1 Tax=Alkalicoccus chagannorensis TaxID=427072 RepID=UPI00040EE0DF|nr:nickel pincer cofactor biosynthesis protein LarC [Alkalicoccus chagannorensis]
MSILYLDCLSGISGDMTLGALIDAGVPLARIEEELNKLPFDEGEYALSQETVVKNGITAVSFRVKLADASGEHSHTHEPLHSHSHHHRTYRDIKQMIEESSLDEAVKATALEMFLRIGEAEGKIHNMPLDQVHFHEVGAVDSIIDIVGTAIAVQELKPEAIYASPIPVGGGKVWIDHGLYPVPAPATTEILKGIPLASSSVQSELTTPTGAAIAAVLVEEFCPLPSMTIDTIGYGAGTKTFPNQPNVLRVLLGRPHHLSS